MVTITLRGSERLYQQILIRTSDNRPFDAQLYFIPSMGGEPEKGQIKIFSIDRDGKKPEVERVNAIHKQLMLEKKVEELTQKCEALQRENELLKEESHTNVYVGKSSESDARFKTIADATDLSPMAVADRKKQKE